MSFEIEGTLKHIGDIKRFDSGSSKVIFSVENTDGYNGSENHYAFELFAGKAKQDRIDNFIKYNKVGDAVQVRFSIESREYKGRWYTDLKAFFIGKATTAAGSAAVVAAADQDIASQLLDGDDKLPF